jgi:hypothetical protein
MFSGSGSIKTIRVRKQRNCDFAARNANGAAPARFYFGVRLPLESEVSGADAENRFTGIEFEGFFPLNCTGARGPGWSSQEVRRG